MEKEQSSLATDNGFSLDLFLGDKEKLAGMWSASEAGTNAAMNEDASETQKIAVEIPVPEEVSEMEPAENDESANEVWETLEAEKEQVATWKGEKKEKKAHGWTYLAVILVGVMGVIAVWWLLSNIFEPEYISEREERVEKKNVSLFELLGASEYTIRYNVNGSAERANDITVQKKDTTVLFENTAVGKMSLYRDGVVYDVDLGTRAVTKRESDATLWAEYLPVLSVNLEQECQESYETLFGVLYRTQDCGALTGFFASDSLKFVRRSDSGVIYVILDYQPHVDIGFDQLPTNYQKNSETRESLGASESTKMQSKAIDGSVPDEVGDIAVGQYLIFD
ncbi:hypothetical protein IJJ27_01930 [bacterium]|nr:hypothetical protein [bacterium]